MSDAGVFSSHSGVHWCVGWRDSTLLPETWSCSLNMNLSVLSVLIWATIVSKLQYPFGWIEYINFITMEMTGPKGWWSTNCRCTGTNWCLSYYWKKCTKWVGFLISSLSTFNNYTPNSFWQPLCFFQILANSLHRKRWRQLAIVFRNNMKDGNQEWV